MPAIKSLLDTNWNSNTMILVLRAVDHFKGLDMSEHTPKLKNKVITNPANLDLVSGIFARDIPKLDSQFWTLVSLHYRK